MLGCLRGASQCWPGLQSARGRCEPQGRPGMNYCCLDTRRTDLKGKKVTCKHPDNESCSPISPDRGESVTRTPPLVVECGPSSGGFGTHHELYGTALGTV